VSFCPFRQYKSPVSCCSCHVDRCRLSSSI
jgi:hypothetical protein